jgi:hypothetical protein
VDASEADAGTEIFCILSSTKKLSFIDKPGKVQPLLTDDQRNQLVDRQQTTAQAGQFGSIRCSAFEPGSLHDIVDYVPSMKQDASKPKQYASVSSDPSDRTKWPTSMVK